MSWDDARVREHVRHLEELLERVSAGPGADAVAALAELYGEALSRVVTIAADAGALPALTGDELLHHLLLLHGLHPDPVADRVRRALAGLAGFLERRHGRAELLGIEDGVVRLAVGASGCATTSRAVIDAVESAVRGAAPEIDRVDIRDPAPQPVLIPLDTLRSRT